MFIKIIIICLLLFNTIPIEAANWVLRMPTMEQVEKLCVPVLLNTDHDYHYFYYKTIKKFDETGLEVKYGKRLENINSFTSDMILNYEEAKQKYEKLKREQP